MTSEVFKGVTLGRMGRPDKAIEDYHRAIALDQNDADVFVNRGLLNLQVGQVRLALSDLKRACGLRDDFGCSALRYYGNHD